MTRRQKDLFPELSDGKKYVSDIPELMAEWHPTKNGELLPEDVSFGSGIKLWWRCSNGHEWIASANTRTNLKSGCAECSFLRLAEEKSKASASYNLEVVNPELCREWHPKNKKSPSEYFPKSSKRVWWQCTKDAEHVWQAQIASRTDLEGNTLIGCPFCSGKRASSGYNLTTERPEILSEWCYDKNEFEPSQLTPNSHTKVWWECAKGHIWLASPHNRRNGKGCPHCTHQTSKAEIRILTEFMSIYEKVFSRHKIDGYELDIYLPELKVGIEYDGSFWHQDKAERDNEKQKYMESIGIRLLRIREAPLPKISKTDLIVNSRVELSKKVINRLVELVGSNTQKANQYTSKEAFVNQDLFNTYLDYFPSPFPEKSLALVNPKVSGEWHPTRNAPLEPSNFTPNSGHKVWWMCGKGHEWQATIDSRNRRQGASGCPYCSSTFRLASPDDNLAVKYPKLLEYLHPDKNGELTPDKITHGSEIPIWWRCPSNPSHEFFRSPNHMTSSNAMELCPFCRGTFVTEINCMATTHPEMASIFHPSLNGSLTPHKVKAGSNKKFWWKCEQGHEWQQSARNIKRRLNDNPCPYCTTLASKRPDVAALLHPTNNGNLTAFDITLYSARKVWWQCRENREHIWQTSAANMVRKDRTALCLKCPPARIRNSMSVTNPNLAKAFHPKRNGQLTTLNTVAGTGKKLWWVCSKDNSHEWLATGDNMCKVKRPDLCPNCRRKLK